MRKRCIRKKWVKSHLLMPEQVSKMVLPLHMALELLPLGLFTREHADHLAKMINIVYVSADDKSPAYLVSRKAGDVLIAMYARVKEGKAWNTTISERDTLKQSILAIDKHIRAMTTSSLKTAAVTIDLLNAEAKAKGYGFLDTAPVKGK